MAVGKSLRFDVFARDAFVCQYCGNRPPDVVLELDHIHPVSKGGTDEVNNLITSCWECNRGKRAKIISEIAPRPDADLALLRVQQEMGEVKRFLKAKKSRDKVYSEVLSVLMEMWKDLLDVPQPLPPIWKSWIKKYGCDEIEYAINRTAEKSRFGDFLRGSHGDKGKQCGQYVSGILRNRWEKTQK